MLAAKAEPNLELIFSKLENHSRIAVAVSGGSDSMALLRLLLQSTKSRIVRPQIFVLTVDHGLRAESSAEAQRVAAWCAALGVHHETLKWQGPKPASGIQAKARAARYALMTEWCLQHSVSVLLTAHTADDQAETVVMRRRRTQSALSLAGIWPTRDWNGIQIVRPLLETSKVNLQDYLKDIGQEWIEDPSNHDRRYERVRIREELREGLASNGAIAALSQIEVKAAEQKSMAWLQACATVSALGLVSVGGDFNTLSELVADLVLCEILKTAAGEALPERERRLALVDWLKSTNVGRKTLGRAVFVKRKTGLFVARESGRIDPLPVKVPASGEIIWDGRFSISGPVGAQILPLRSWGDLPQKNLPQYLRLGLPAAFIAGKLVFVPQLRPNDMFNCSFIRKFRWL